VKKFEREGAEAEPKEKHGVWNPMPELTIISRYVDSRVDSNICTMARVDLNHQSGTEDLASELQLLKRA
jgi:hypothetical protein